MRIIVSWSNGVLPSVGETNVSVILYVYHSINLAKIYCTAWNEYVNDTTFHMLSWDAKVRVAYMSPALLWLKSTSVATFYKIETF